MTAFDPMQGILLEILVALGILKSHYFWLDVEHIEEATQNILVCIEMVFFSVLQQYAYHVAPYSGDVEAKMKLNKKREWCEWTQKKLWDTTLYVIFIMCCNGKLQRIACLFTYGADTFFCFASFSRWCGRWCIIQTFSKCFQW